MIELEYIPVVIEAHRADLRRLYDPGSLSRPRQSPRRRIGAGIIRFGHWVEDRCSEVAVDAPMSPTGQRVRA